VFGAIAGWTIGLRRGCVLVVGLVAPFCLALARIFSPAKNAPGAVAIFRVENFIWARRHPTRCVPLDRPRLHPLRQKLAIACVLLNPCGWETFEKKRGRSSSVHCSMESFPKDPNQSGSVCGLFSCTVFFRRSFGNIPFCRRARWVDVESQKSLLRPRKWAFCFVIGIEQARPHWRRGHLEGPGGILKSGHGAGLSAIGCGGLRSGGG